MRVILISTIIFSSFVSCSLSYRVLSGIKRPKVESCKSISNYVDRKGLSKNNLFFLTDSCYIRLISSNNKYFATYEVFDAKGNTIKLIDSIKNECYGNIEKELLLLGKNANWTVDINSELNFFDLRRNLRNLNGSEPTFNPSIENGKSFHVVVYWSKFMGKYTKSLFSIAKKLEEVPTTDVYLVNMDKYYLMGDSLQKLKIHINGR